jgi:hypothetical protein
MKQAPATMPHRMPKANQRPSDFFGGSSIAAQRGGEVLGM